MSDMPDEIWACWGGSIDYEGSWGREWKPSNGVRYICADLVAALEQRASGLEDRASNNALLRLHAEYRDEIASLRAELDQRTKDHAGAMAEMLRRGDELVAAKADAERNREDAEQHRKLLLTICLCGVVSRGVRGYSADCPIHGINGWAIDQAIARGTK